MIKKILYLEGFDLPYKKVFRNIIRKHYLGIHFQYIEKYLLIYLVYILKLL